MPRSKEKIIADLVVLQVDYDEEMSYQELWDLLEKAKADKEVAKADREKLLAQAEAKGKAKEPLNKDMAGVTCGLRTTQNHEMRLRVIEHEMGL